MQWAAAGAAESRGQPLLQVCKERDLLQQRAEAAEAELARERSVHRRELRRRAKELADAHQDLLQVLARQPVWITLLPSACMMSCLAFSCMHVSCPAHAGALPARRHCSYVGRQQAWLCPLQPSVRCSAPDTKPDWTSH